jgi:hypothetical protein
MKRAKRKKPGARQVPVLTLRVERTGQERLMENRGRLALNVIGIGGLDNRVNR